MKTYLKDPLKWENLVIAKKELMDGNEEYAPKAFQDLMERFNDWAAQNGYGLIYDENIGYRAVKKTAYTDGETLSDLPIEGFHLASDAEVKKLTNERIRQERRARMTEEADPLKYDYEEALARGDKKAKDLKKRWLLKKDEIREALPYGKIDE